MKGKLTAPAVKIGYTENIRSAALGVAVEAGVADGATSTTGTTTIALVNRIDSSGEEGDEESSQLHFDGLGWLGCLERGSATAVEDVVAKA